MFGGFIMPYLVKTFLDNFHYAFLVFLCDTLVRQFCSIAFGSYSFLFHPRFVPVRKREKESGIGVLGPLGGAESWTS